MRRSTDLTYHRLFEWIATGIMLGMSAELFATPNSISATAYRIMAVNIPQSYIALILFAFGMVRIIALMANGLVPYYGPLARATCALAGAFMWLQFMLALLDWAAIQSIVSPGVPVYFFLTIGEIASCYRAASDGNRSKFLN